MIHSADCNCVDCYAKRLFKCMHGSFTHPCLICAQEFSIPSLKHLNIRNITDEDYLKLFTGVKHPK